MAKILIGLYRTLTEAEAVAHDLVEQGVARPNITLATPYATLPYPEATDIKTCSTLAGGEGLRAMLLNLEVSENEASLYVEAVRRGEVMVVVEASDAQADMVVDILHGRRSGNGLAGHTQWRYVDNVGVVSHDDPAQHPVHGTADASGFARYAANFREHHTKTVTESGLTYMEYEPAYRYGYDVGAHYPDQDWVTLEEGIRRGWELWHPGTWERFKGAIRHGWNTFRAYP
jgi:hypothetical protein